MEIWNGVISMYIVGIRQTALLLTGILLAANTTTPSQITEVNKAEISVAARNNGHFAQNVFFAGKGAGYELEILHGEGTSGTLAVKIGEREIEAQVEEGRAEFSIGPSVEGSLRVSYKGALGDASVELPDYIVAEDTPPIVKSAVLEGEDGKKLQVTIEDAGDIVSGIRGYEYFLNGEKPEDCLEEEIEGELANGTPVCRRVEIAIPIDGPEAYELEVKAEDWCGNQTEKTLTKGELQEEQEKMPSSEQMERNIEQNGIAVVLPTDISLMVFTGPNPAEGNIQSQDIMVINKNEFPVRVHISQVQYEVEQDEEEQKRCELGVKVREYNKEEEFVEITDSEGGDPFYMELAAGSEDTDAQALLEKASGWAPTGDVSSPDYGVLRLEGSTTQGNNWKNGDLKVHIVFDLERIE